MGLRASLARRLNSSRLVPGPVRQRIGGRFFRSADYRVLGTDQAAAMRQAEALDGWYRPTVAHRHQHLWHPGGQRPGDRNLALALDLFESPRSLLEVGCGNGFTFPILAACGAEVFGVDRSKAMLGEVDLVRGHVLQADAAALPFATASIDVVVDGAALMHVTAWQDSLAEQARVAREGLVLHTVTVTDSPTTYLSKRAYGYLVPEVALNAQDLRRECGRHGLTLISATDDFPYDLAAHCGISTKAQTWVLRRSVLTDTHRRTVAP